jgi:hypothetical protein
MLIGVICRADGVVLACCEGASDDNSGAVKSEWLALLYAINAGELYAPRTLLLGITLHPT